MCSKFLTIAGALALSVSSMVSGVAFANESESAQEVKQPQSTETVTFEYVDALEGYATKEQFDKHKDNCVSRLEKVFVDDHVTKTGWSYMNYIDKLQFVTLCVERVQTLEQKQK